MKTPTAFRPPAQGCPRGAGYPGYARFNFPQPQRGCGNLRVPNRPNPVGVENHFGRTTQGSSSAPTLGWRPLPRWGKPADKARHDKLVLLVDKMLGLAPKLRAATLDAEKAVLQNAVTATETLRSATIASPLHDFYGLTPEEIALLEGGQ
jgi:hypothetical protein